MRTAGFIRFLSIALASVTLTACTVSIKPLGGSDAEALDSATGSIRSVPQPAGTGRTAATPSIAEPAGSVQVASASSVTASPSRGDGRSGDRGGSRGLGGSFGSGRGSGFGESTGAGGQQGAGAPEQSDG